MRKNQLLLGISLVVIGAIIITILPNNLPERIRSTILAVTEILAICVGVILILYGWINDDIPKEVKENENKKHTK